MCLTFSHSTLPNDSGKLFSYTSKRVMIFCGMIHRRGSHPLAILVNLLFVTTDCVIYDVNVFDDSSFTVHLLFLHRFSVMQLLCPEFHTDAKSLVNTVEGFVEVCKVDCAHDRSILQSVFSVC